MNLLERLQALGQRIDRAVLPPVRDPGSMPWTSLVDMIFPFLPLFMDGIVHTDWWRTAAADLLFLPLYFGFFWARGWRRIAIVLAIATIAPALAPSNVFSNSYTIYACVLAAFLPLRQALPLIGLACAMYMVPPFVLHEPPSMYFLTGVFTGVLVSVCQRMWIQRARSNQALRLSIAASRRLAQVAERERIGRDLHDLLGHTLSVVALKSELARKLIDRDLDAARAEIGEVERVARDALSQVRNAVSGIRSTAIAAELQAAISLLEAQGVKVKCETERVKLPHDRETALALSLREATTNIRRHASASGVTIKLREDSGRVVMEVVDNGRGGRIVPGNGLNGMRERLGNVGGTLSLEPVRDGGTRLFVSIPTAA